MTCLNFDIPSTDSLKTSYRKFTLDAPGVKVLNQDITPGANAENGGGRRGVNLTLEIQ